MVKQLFLKDFKSYKSPVIQNLLKTSAGLAANQKGERAQLITALKTGISTYPGDPTRAIATTVGMLESSRLFDRSEIIKIKEGLRQSGYFVPKYSIKKDAKFQGRFDRADKEKKGDDKNNKDINQQISFRETNVRSEKPIKRDYESRLQTIAKLPNQTNLGK